VKRRDVLKSIGAFAGIAGASRLLSACGGGVADGTPGIRNIVLLMMENRSYDHWMGARSMLEGKPGDGLKPTMSNLTSTGVAVPVFAVTKDTYCVPDPPHGWDGSHTQFAAGANSGFIIAHQQDHPGDVQVMQYMQRADLPVTYALADAYASSDRWHASVMGPTWPNRMYWLAGTSMGMKSNDVPAGGFTAPTIFDRLADAAVDFKIYYGDLPFIPLLGAGVKVPLDGKLLRMKQFFADAAAGTLPSVSYIDPPFSFGDDHPPHDPAFGQALVASVYNALAASPQWSNTLLLLTYDEHGGFFDHVAPPAGQADEHTADGFDQLGFRVPALVIGPYAKQGYLSSVQRDHTSALKHLETMFGTEPLTARSTAATDLAEMIDLDRLAAGQPAAPITIPEVIVDDTMIPPQCQSTVAGHPVLETADAHPERVRGLDARAELPETWRHIAHWARRPVRG
jgi:phospholipase C